MIYEKLKENYTLEDWYNILERNKPTRENHLYSIWFMLIKDTKKELENKEERPNECEFLINDIISFLQKQKTEVLKNEF